MKIDLLTKAATLALTTTPVVAQANTIRIVCDVVDADNPTVVVAVRTYDLNDAAKSITLVETDGTTNNWCDPNRCEMTYTPERISWVKTYQNLQVTFSLNRISGQFVETW